MNYILLWLDLETTGLDAHDDQILEVAWTWTTPDLRQLTRTESRVVTIGKTEWGLIKADPFIQDMHGKTGLLKALEEGGTLMLGDIEDQILHDMYHHHLEEGTVIHLAGASVHFDRKFIDHYMSRLAAKLHHRVYDTSTLKMFFEELSIEHGVLNNMQHRAGDDVREVLDVAQSYRSYVRGLEDQIESEYGIG